MSAPERSRLLGKREKREREREAGSFIALGYVRLRYVAVCAFPGKEANQPEISPPRPARLRDLQMRAFFFLGGRRRLCFRAWAWAWF